MAENPPSRVDPNQIAEIVSSYVRHHRIAADQLAGLIVEVHRALASLGRAPPVQQPPRPAVPVQRSLQQDYIVCLECGFRAQTLRRHLRVAHGLEDADYRARWQLPGNYPFTAPGYSARRSTIAKQMGFGRKPGTIVTRPRAAGRRRRRRPASEG
jgi:predicted transcriptional regulator